MSALTTPRPSPWGKQAHHPRRRQWHSATRRPRASSSCCSELARRCWSAPTRPTSCWRCGPAAGTVHAGPHFRQADGPGRGRIPAGHRHAQGSVVLAKRTRHCPAGRAGRPARRLLPAAVVPRDGRYRHSRDGLGRRRAVDGQHAVLLSGDAQSRLQLRPAVAAAVHLGTRRRRSLPSQWPGDGGRPAEICLGARHDRCPRRLAGR